MTRRKHNFRREPRTDLEDLRDDTIAVVLNSGKSFKKVEEDGGPTAGTLSKWLYKETLFPRLDTIRAALQACNYDFAVVPITAGGRPPKIERLRPTTTAKLPIRKRHKKIKGRRA